MCLCVQCLQRSDEGMRAVRTGIIGHGNLPDLGAENQTQVFFKSSVCV